MPRSSKATLLDRGRPGVEGEDVFFVQRRARWPRLVRRILLIPSWEGREAPIPKRSVNPASDIQKLRSTGETLKCLTSNAPTEKACSRSACPTKRRVMEPRVQAMMHRFSSRLLLRVVMALISSCPIPSIEAQENCCPEDRARSSSDHCGNVRAVTCWLCSVGNCALEIYLDSPDRRKIACGCGGKRFLLGA